MTTDDDTRDTLENWLIEILGHGSPVDALVTNQHVEELTAYLAPLIRERYRLDTVVSSRDELREGDHVEVTYTGWVDSDGWIRSHNTEACLLAPPHNDDSGSLSIRLVHRPKPMKPEPDPAEVERLARLLHQTDHKELDIQAPTWEDLAEWAKERYRDQARALLREHDVKVVNDE